MLPLYWTSRLRSRNILVELEPSIRNTYRVNQNINSNDFSFSVNLFDLIVKTGTINTRLPYHPLQKEAFDHKKDIFANVRTEDSDLRLIRIENDKTKRELSEDIGVGMAAIIVDELFGIDWSTISYVTGINGRRPDIACYTVDGRKIVFEAKGSTNKYTRNSLLNYAVLYQKNVIPANINLAVGTFVTTLDEGEQSNVVVRDPPINNEKIDINSKVILKTLHYSRAFNFINQYELSKYFYYMKKRIKNGRDFPEYRDKLALFKKLTTEYKRIRIQNKNCVGTIRTIDKESDTYIFRGVFEDLLTIRGIFDFVGEMEIKPIIKNNYYLKLYPDGICIGLFDSIKTFEKVEIKEKPQWET